MATIKCKNCDHLFEGNFCPQCGQSSDVHGINAVYFLHDIPHSVFHVDKGLPYTFRQLIIRPGKTLKEFLEGKRVQHYKPFAYVVILSAICSLVIHWNTILIKTLDEAKSGTVVSITEPFFTKYPSIFIFLMIPLVSGCTWLIFRKHNYNFWEHVLINTYLSAQLNVILMLLQLFVLVKYFITGLAQYHTFSVMGFMTGFMTYYAFAFSTIMKKDEAGWKLAAKLGLMCFVLAFLYITGMINTRMTSIF